VEERLKKAAEFAYVPGEWGIEAKKPEIKKEDAEGDEEDDLKGWDAGLPTKRVKGTLNEDELMEMWAIGHRTAFDRQYQRDKRFGQGEGGEGGEDEDEEEDEEMEDVEVDGLTPSQSKGKDAQEEEGDEEDEEDVKAVPAPPVQLIQRAPPSVHKPLAGAPVLPLGVVHRFMATGEVQSSR
jgi:hypothetical protein